MLWNSVHIFVARLVLPRWLTVERAELPNGIVLVRQVDPVQHWLGWRPNPHGGWKGNFYDPPDAAGHDAGTPRVRLGIINDDTLEPWDDGCTRHVGNYCFGASPSGLTYRDEWHFPPVGSPGFGAAFPGPSRDTVLIGAFDDRADAWIWFGMYRGDGAHGKVTRQVIGYGYFRLDETHGDWLFIREHPCFDWLDCRYCNPAPALEALCTWDPVAEKWLPNLARMRRPVSGEYLNSLREAAAAAYDECERDYLEWIATGADPELGEAETISIWRDGGGEDDGTPCSDMQIALAKGVLEFVASGRASEWELWVRAAWPTRSTATFRDRFIAAVRESLASSECADILHELNKPVPPDHPQP